MKAKLLLIGLMVVFLTLLNCGGTDTNNNGDDTLASYNFDEYANDAFPTGWTVYDEPEAQGDTSNNTSNWKIQDKQFYQASNIHGLDSTNNLRGTFAYTGSEEWTDYVFEVDFTPKDNDAIGVIFRHTKDTDGKHLFYRFLMINDAAYGGESLRLYYFDGDKYTEIKRIDDYSFDIDVKYHLKVEVIGSSIKIYRDGLTFLTATDTSLTKGNVGLYCFSMKAYFDNVLVTAYGN